MHMNRAIALEPDNTRALRELSLACHALDQNDSAIALARRALALAPDDGDAVVHAAEVLMRSGRPGFLGHQ